MQIRECGSLTLLVPGTEVELQWLKDNCNTQAWQWFGVALAVDPRMVEAIMEGFASGRQAFDEE